MIENVVTYDVVVAAANPGLKLLPGMTANVKILVAQHEWVLLIHNAALRVRLNDTAPTGAPPVGRRRTRRHGPSGPERFRP